MKITIAFLILTGASFAATAQGKTKCFQNDALKGTQFVNLKIDKTRISGTFEYENGESELARKYVFSGTMGGDVLRVRFDGGELPDVAPSEMKDLNWRLLKSDGGEILRIKFYGKNYEINKYADYFADFVPCEMNYGLMERNAETVRFAKGETSAKVPLSFKNTGEKKIFSLNIGRGQRFEINAPGCKISVYLPDGKIYEYVEWENGAERTFASSAIDRMTVKTIPQTGKYLVALEKLAEAAQPDSVTFSITK